MVRCVKVLLAVLLLCASSTLLRAQSETDIQSGEVTLRETPVAHSQFSQSADLDGKITGVAVDDHNRPISYAQVSTLMNELSTPTFAHRYCDSGNVESICLACLIIVASCTTIEQALRAEKRHVCLSESLSDSSRLPSTKRSRSQTSLVGWFPVLKVRTVRPC
jgi:hypothetical protein